ncbi:MAG: hypothetical protein J7L88_04235 [Thermoplasmata archaeon]|nr:hypothetical protein [Thermoplasmata archaeon]
MEEETFNLWKELNPVSAYAQGLSECAGRIFIPTPKNVEEMLKRLQAVKVESEVEEMLIENFQINLTHIEPHHIPSSSLWAIFYHLVLEGPAGEHMGDLLEAVKELLDSSTRILGEEYPPEIRVLAHIEASGLITILESLSGSNPFLRVMVEDVMKRADEFRERYRMVGILKGVYEEIYPLLAEQETHLKRDDYSEILRGLYGYPYTPAEIEEKALRWIKEGMKPFAEALQENASRAGVAADVEKVEGELTKIDGEKVGEFLGRIREVLLPVVKKRLIDVPPEYNTELMQTPEYLRPLIPTAAMTPMGTLTGSPRSIFFYTVSEKVSLPDMVLSLVHEEYGHAVHYTLSSLNPFKVSTLLERIDTSFSLPISEGISFHRELEFLNLLKEIDEGVGGEEERRLKEFFERHYPGGLKRAILEMSYEVHKWRFIRFLRALGDVRINTGKQSLYEFVEWAHRFTSLKREDIFNQIFIFQETPGYAPSYSLGEEVIQKIQKLGLEAGMELKDVNTEIAARGFLPLKMFIKWFEERYS